MKELNDNTSLNIMDFFNKLREADCISLVWEKLLDLLKNLQPSISSQALALFTIYFSQLDDGNICIPLDEKMLCEKWDKKWAGLLLIENKSGQFEADSQYFSQIIKSGINQLNAKTLPNLIIEASSGESAKQDFSKPFIVEQGWLFATKFYKAKLSIEKNIKEIMKPGQSEISEEKKEEIKEYFQKLTSSEGKKPMTLKDEQLQAILRGEKENLIITGGPGTGKTTVVCYLLWRLLLTGDYIDYSLHLAAPSGKAADRMKESISDTLASLNLDQLTGSEKSACQAVFEKLNTASSSTIHRLLSFNPSTNGFKYNADNQFEEKSIFVIDEASMIDITLFSSLLEAIPSGARVFILGDKDQLPSVQAGAVLGELLANKKDSVAELKESSRFNDDSDVGRLKNAMQEESPLDLSLAHFIEWEDWKLKNNFSIPEDKSFPVTSFLTSEGSVSSYDQLEEITEKWADRFYTELTRAAMELTPESDISLLDAIWEKAGRARILSAERRGYKGVESINRKICEYILNQNTGLSGDNYFKGQLLMLTKNQNLFCLYNGDSGIVVEYKNLKYLMVKKELKSKTRLEDDVVSTNERSLISQGIKQQGSYIFYPLHLLPKDSIETAYAITIHKSQGSGYKAILVLLPDQPGHPLLNRQIAYTAITRTQGSTYLLTTPKALEAARKSIIQRDTQIRLD